MTIRAEIIDGPHQGVQPVPKDLWDTFRRRGVATFAFYDENGYTYEYEVIGLMDTTTEGKYLRMRFLRAWITLKEIQRRLGELS